MNTNDIFGWENPEVIGYKSIADQKNATRADVSDGVFNGNAWDSFRTNDDNVMIPEIANVIGMDPKVLVFGEGMEDQIVVNHITTAAEYEAAKTGCLADYVAWMEEKGEPLPVWADGMAWAVANFKYIDGNISVTVNGSTENVAVEGVTDDKIPVTKKSTFIIVDKGEVKVNDVVVDDVKTIGFKVA